MTSVEVKKALEQLLRDPDNQKCADCKALSHPRWSSWSLGVFVCIKCAGFHRSLGTHISKVKSVDLDTWKEEHLRQLVYFGNNRNANAVFESALGGGTYMPDQSKVGQFIKTKYELRKWYGKPAVASTSPSLLDMEKSPKEIEGKDGRHVTSSASSTPDSKTSRSPVSTSMMRNISPVSSRAQQQQQQQQLPANNSRPDLKKSILSLYSKPKTSQSLSPPPASVPISAPPSFNPHNSTVSLEDNELFKNVWT
ncbi:HCL146Cp [Eremothecium sinecaudum]|uniref:HCL146Cp n=1 Tax=Eremothecium sinecaudum TaxID=45286 RepID=A0A0X8HRB6_9SACH|nr:HCL146Cp [Eremothecium sinecaudum]AMD20005.1 HCL146Cp [Eremothecium sinecaudum]